MSASEKGTPRDELVRIGWTVEPRRGWYAERYMDMAAALGVAIVEAALVARPEELPPDVAALVAALERLETDFAMQQPGL